MSEAILFPVAMIFIFSIASTALTYYVVPTIREDQYSNGRILIEIWSFFLFYYLIFVLIQYR